MHSAFIDSPVLHKIIQAFCWMLVHSMWQGLILTILTALGIVLTRRYHSSVRYNIVICLFFSFLITCLLTFIHEYNVLPDRYGFYDSPVADYGKPSFLTNIYQLGRMLDTFSSYCSLHAEVIVISWFFIFFLKSIKMARSLFYVRKISNNGISVPGDCWIEKVASLSSKLQIKKKISLLESSSLRIPVVIGYLKPMIIIPFGLMTSLPADQIEAVLMHELAHIRRGDYCINFLQNVAETIFFFNPALLWISAVIKEERENCCDDIALYHTKNKKQFLEALISFKEFASTGIRSYAVAFPGKRNLLLHRVKRIITNRNKSLAVPEKLFFFFSLVIGTMFLMVVIGKPHQKITNNHVTRMEATPTTTALSEERNAQDKAVSQVKPKLKRRMPGTKIASNKLFNVPQIQQVVIQDSKVVENVDDENANAYLQASRITDMERNRSLLRKQEDELMREKLEVEKQVSNDQKAQSLRDAERANLDKLRSQADFRRASYDQAQALIMQQKAYKDAEAAYQIALHLKSNNKD